MSVRITEEVTALQMLDVWQRSEAAPQAKEFFPSPSQPILEVEIGCIDEKPVVAYGVRCATVFAGLIYEHMPHWRWFLDHDRAITVAAFCAYQMTYEARLWESEVVADPSVPAELYQKREVTPPVGPPFSVFCIVYYESGRYFRRLCLEQGVCNVLHETLRIQWAHLEIDVPEIAELETGLVPDIVEEVLGRCLHCGQMLTQYLTLKLVPGYGISEHLEPFSSLDREAAIDRRREVVAHVIRLKVQQEKERVQRETQALADDVLGDAQTLLESKRFRVLKGGVDTAILEPFECPVHSVREIGESLDLAHALDARTKELRYALDFRELEIREEIAAHGLMDRLRTVLASAMPTCPICRSSYQSSAAFLDELLVLGSARLPCACPKYYSISATAPAPFPEMLALNSRPLLTFEIRGEEVEWIEVRRLDVGGTPVARFGVMRAVGCHLLAVDREAFRDADGDARLVNVWEQTARQAHAVWTAELESLVAKKELLKLELRYDEGHQGWNARRTEGRVTVVYAVERGYSEKIVEPGEYYCRVIAEPRRAQTETFKLVLLEPIRRAASRAPAVRPREQRHPRHARW